MDASEELLGAPPGTDRNIASPDPSLGVRLLAVISPPVGAHPWLRDSLHRLRRGPEFRTLRWTLLVGLVVRLALAPISSWSGDTTGFALGDLSFVYSGSPYSSYALFNPPLASFLQLPLFSLLLLFVPPQSLVTYAPALLPPSSAIGPAFVTPWIASPAALVALKLPLIAADVGTTLLLVVLVRRAGFAERATTVAAAYFLNPLIIWVSSVHAEPDGLAAFFVVLFLACMAFGWAFGSGVALSLSIFSKAYPVILVPLGIAFWIALPPGSWGAVRSRIGRLAAYSAGLAVVAAVFLPYLNFTPAVVSRNTPVDNFGGISVLVLYNVGSPPLAGLTGDWVSAVPGGALLAVFETLAAATIVGAAVVFGYRTWRRSNPPSAPVVIRWAGLASLASVTGLLLAYPAPQPENIVAVVPLALLAASVISSRRFRASYWALSLAGFGLYLSYGTPIEGFMPLMILLGHPWVDQAGSIFIAYGQGAYLMPPGYYWFLVGIIGGVAMLALWAVSCWMIVPKKFRRGVRRRVAALWSR